MTSSPDPREGLPSASEMHRIMACPGYLHAKKTFPLLPEEPDQMRDSGTKTHTVLELMIDGKPVEMNLTDIENFIVNACDDMGKRLTARVFPGIDPSALKFYIKRRFWLRDSEGRKLCSGEPDLMVNDGTGKWLIVDYKRGPKPVPVATHNWQLQTYAVLASHDPDFQKEIKGFFDEVYCAIFQPLVSSRPVTVKLSGSELKYGRSKIASTIAGNWVMHDLPRIPGTHCDYCPVRHCCPEAQIPGMMMQIRTGSTEAIESLTDADLIKLYPRLNSIIDIAERVKEFFKQRVAAGAIPGYEIYDHAAGYTIEDPKEMLRLVSAFIPASEFRTMLKVQMGQIREVWVARFAEAFDVTKKVALQEWENTIVPHLTPLPVQKRVRKIKDEQVKTIEEASG